MRACVNGRANVLICQALTGLQAHYVWAKGVGEDVVDAGATRELRLRDAVCMGPIDNGYNGIGVLSQEVEEQPPSRHGGDLVIAQLAQHSVGLGDQVVHLCLEVWEGLPDMLQEDGVEDLAKVWCPHAGGNPAVGLVALEELLLRLEGSLDVLVGVDVLLAAVHHTNVAPLQGHHLPHEDVHCIRAPVHQVQFGQHAKGAVPSRVHVLRNLDGIGVRQVLVRSRHCEDDAILLGDVLHHQLPDLRLHVWWLVPHCHFRNARQVNEGQVQDVWGVDAQLDGPPRDGLASPRLNVRSVLDLLSDLAEVVVLPARLVEEFPMWPLISGFLGGVMELEDQWPSGYDA
mmetsp:Transcript_123882/g.214766  ORF Transcript_123882/g.214766 Transcript_123882/m.214766 type:complete len:343 (-) Transcript_123882:169-1197(-)